MIVRMCIEALNEHYAQGCELQSEQIYRVEFNGLILKML